MIKTLSPHYKFIPWVHPFFGFTSKKYILRIYVWKGDKASQPTEPTYSQENINSLSRTGNTEVNISRFINDFLTANLITSSTTSINDADSTVWVGSNVVYYDDIGPYLPVLDTQDIALKGYGYGMEGVNPVTPTNNYLATTSEQKVSRNSVYLFSFLASETVDTVIKLNDLTLTKTATTDSTSLVQTCYVKVSEFTTDFIEIYKDNVLINTLLLTDELRYTPIDVVFLNKEGQLQTITLFKEKLTSLKTDSETYESSNGQPSTGVHQFKSYNVNGRESFSIESGFVLEDNNEIFTQLLLNTRVWQIKDNIYTPLNIETSDIEFQSRQKDRLLNYKIDFKYSFNKINNI